MNSVIIVAGGTGSRMKAEGPKQFALLHDKPVIVYAIEKFLQFDPKIEIVIAVRPEYVLELEAILKKFNLPRVQLANGGETRFHSVKNGLEKLSSAATLVAVHDAARPLVSLQTIQNTFSAAQKSGAAIPVLEVNESLREVDTLGSRAVNRKDYRIVQTPQCFRKPLLLDAYDQNYAPEFTDDATVAEAAGHKIQLVEGNRENIKITYPHDLAVATVLLNERFK
jgi:2-C-methyl-D-erythritol 4-phosphate cytidylyltransferase